MINRCRNISFCIACSFSFVSFRTAYLLTSQIQETRDNGLVYDDDNDIADSKADFSVASQRDLPRKHSNSNFQKCMLNLETQLDPLIKTWNSANVPIPFSVKIVDNSFYVLSSLLDDRFEWREDPYKYSCNNVSGAEILSAKRPGMSILIVRCPAILDPSNTTLSTFSIQSQKQTEEISYDLSMYDECERKDIDMYNNSNRPKKIGITATFTGNRRRAAEWAVYHHLLGVDHIWLYVNEDWNEGRDLIDKDYITWIPYNFHVVSSAEKHHWTPHEFFRVASMNDALWRAKRMGLAWMSMIDIDEYIFVPPLLVQKDHSEGNSTKVSLSRKLPEFLADENVNGCMAIEMTNEPFGRNPNTEDEQEPELLMDYVYRKPIDMNDKKRDRVKIIIDVHDVTSINIHFVGGDIGIRKCRLRQLKGNETRVNHYKNPERGVFKSKVNTKLVKDSLLTDEYRSFVIKELQTNN